MRILVAFSTLTALLLVATGSTAATWIDNAPAFFAGPSEECYAESIPKSQHGLSGRTYVYRVGYEKDTLVHTFRWYSSSLEILCNVPGLDQNTGIAIVRHWAEAVTPSPGLPRALDFSVAIYFDGKLKKRHTERSFFAEKGTVLPTPYRSWIALPIGPLEITTGDGQVLAFDIATGQLLSRVTDSAAWRPRDLHGKVRNDLGEPVVGAKVQVFDIEDRLLAQTRTNMAGTYFFLALPETSHRVLPNGGASHFARGGVRRIPLLQAYRSLKFTLSV